MFTFFGHLTDWACLVVDDGTVVDRKFLKRIEEKAM
jgi:hypothetical protein